MTDQTVVELTEDEKIQHQLLRESLSKEVAGLRDSAVTGRKESGIEDIWREDEEYYEGIDDANREHARYLKSPSSQGGLSRAKTSANGQCTAFFNITRQFVDSGAARMGDILLPSTDWNFTIKATPVADGQDSGPQVLKAEKRIQDWLVECHYRSEVRKAIEDAAKVGSGVLKGPYPDKSKNLKVVQSGVEVDEKLVPVSAHVDYWDCFPDPACGENIHDGSHFLHRDKLTARHLKDLKGIPGYISEAIDAVLDEGPGKRNYEDQQKHKATSDADLFEVWYFYGDIEIDKVRSMKVPVSDDHKGETMPMVVTLVNDTAIKAFINPLDTGDFPFDVFNWQRKKHTWAGTGIARQGRTPQDMLNASARAMMDNGGLTAGPMFALMQGKIVPADGVWSIGPRKVFLIPEGSDIRSANDALAAINIPTQQESLSQIVQLAYKMMEDATGIFLIMQGQQGAAPDTVGGMELLNRNASAVLRRLARTFDEMVTEPHIRRYYKYLMEHGPDDSEKGEFVIEAIGSSALVEREVQALEALQMLQMSVNPAFGLDPELAAEEVLRSRRFVPEKWKMSAEKRAKIPPPVVPQVEVAKIRAQVDGQKIEVDRWKKKVDTTTKLREIEVDTDRDSVYNKIMANRDQLAAMSRREELMLRRELAVLEFANREKITLDQAKVQLSTVAMKLRTTKELAGVKASADLLPAPVVEPPQQARPGHSFSE